MIVSSQAGKIQVLSRDIQFELAAVEHDSSLLIILYDVFVDDTPIELSAGGLNEIYVFNGKIIGIGRDRGRIMFNENQVMCNQMLESLRMNFSTDMDDVLKYVDCSSR